MEINKNKDILEVFASLNNHEIFTQPSLAKEMINLIPEEVFLNPESKFLDPATKTGVFLREIAIKLHRTLATYKNSNGISKVIGYDGNVYDLSRPQERLNHILKNMIFGIATSEITSYMSRRTLYGVMKANSDKKMDHIDTIAEVEESKGKEYIDKELTKLIEKHNFNDYFDINLFKDYGEFAQEGNIFYSEKEVEEKISKNKEDINFLEESYFPFIENTKHTKILEIKGAKMKFDVIIGNPPYQVNDGGGKGSSAISIYHKFIEKAIELNPKYISMIVPSRWLTGGRGLDKFREKMLNDNRLAVIVDFKNSKKCFPNVDIKGGVNYFLWDKNYNGHCNYNGIDRQLNEYDIFIRNNNALSIINKVLIMSNSFMNEKVLSRAPFNIKTNFKDYKKEKFENSIKLYGNKQNMKDTNGIGYIDKNFITKNIELINQHKIIIPKASGTGHDKIILGKPIYAEPGSICSETYLLIDYFDTKEEALNLIEYIKTKFFRFLISLRKTTQNTAKATYSFVPDLPMDRIWTDEMLYEKYNLNLEEIEYIESKIAPIME